MNDNRIECLFLSQEDLLKAGCLDMRLATGAAEEAMLAFRREEILFPDKVVQIFDEDTQERINCLPATLLADKVCGVGIRRGGDRVEPAVGERCHRLTAPWPRA